jgi:DnaJ-domain-containing protein 1
MAPRFSRRRDPADEPADEEGADDGDADLGADEHAWWAQRDIEDAWTPHARPDPEEEAPPRDVLADHFGADWRTSFGFDDPSGPVPSDPVPNPPEPGLADPEAEAPVPVIDTSDPYAVLEVDPAASWEQIVTAHRNQARRHHPDGLFGRSEEEVAAAEDRIRSINVAYQELRIRRGR